MKTTGRLSTLLGTLALGALLGAGPDLTPGKSGAFKPIQVDTAIQPPPQPGTAKDKQDMAAIEQAQASRTKADCDRAASEVALTVAAFGPPYGPLTDAEVKRLEPFFSNIQKGAGPIIHTTKDHWPRKRPYDENPRLTPCVEKEASNSYPSGHAALSRVYALTLAAIDPQREAAFKTRGDQIAADRVLAGLHHPSDIDTGKELGSRIFSSLMTSDDFKAQLKGALSPAAAPSN